MTYFLFEVVGFNSIYSSRGDRILYITASYPDTNISTGDYAVNNNKYDVIWSLTCLFTFFDARVTNKRTYLIGWFLCMYLLYYTKSLHVKSSYVFLSWKLSLQRYKYTLNYNMFRIQIVNGSTMMGTHLQLSLYG